MNQQRKTYTEFDLKRLADEADSAIEYRMELRWLAMQRAEANGESEATRYSLFKLNYDTLRYTTNEILRVGLQANDDDDFLDKLIDAIIAFRRA